MGNDRVYVDSLDRNVPVDLPTEDWHTTVLEDHIWMMEYGCSIDLRSLPEPMFQAHLALIRGVQQRRQEEADVDSHSGKVRY